MYVGIGYRPKWFEIYCKFFLDNWSPLAFFGINWLVCALGPALWVVPPGVERQLQPPPASSVHPAHRSWPHIHDASRQSHPHNPPSIAPGRPPSHPADFTVLPPFRPTGDKCPNGPPLSFTWGDTESHLSACLWPLPSGGTPCAPGHCGAKPPLALSNPPPSRPIQASVPPSLLHRITCIRRFPAQSHQTKPVPIHLRLALQPSGGLPTQTYRQALCRNHKPPGSRTQSHGAREKESSFFKSHRLDWVQLKWALKEEMFGKSLASR